MHRKISLKAVEIRNEPFDAASHLFILLYIYQYNILYVNINGKYIFII